MVTDLLLSRDGHTFSASPLQSNSCFNLLMLSPARCQAVIAPSSPFFDFVIPYWDFVSSCLYAVLSEIFRYRPTMYFTSAKFPFACVLWWIFYPETCIQDCLGSCGSRFIHRSLVLSRHIPRSGRRLWKRINAFVLHQIWVPMLLLLLLFFLYLLRSADWKPRAAYNHARGYCKAVSWSMLYW